VNKVTIKGASHALLHFGPAQAAIAKAVMDSVADGVIPKEEVENWFLVVSVFIEWDAEDKDKVYEYNYQATKDAIKRAFSKEPKVDEILAQKDKLKHPFR
jgi:5,6,7,8-tetrahydromethanopterin hydro-lyase